MVPLGAHQAYRPIATVTLNVLLVVLAPCLALAVEPDAEDDRLLIQVQEILSRDGAYSLALLEPLARLGQLYQESDDNALALATLERALQVLRAMQPLDRFVDYSAVNVFAKLFEVGDARRIAGYLQDMLDPIHRASP